MTALVWDQVGERRYETGIDHGVLYLTNGVAVPWNGLMSITETRSREVRSFFQDGVKYLDQQIPGPYAAKLKAFTYPDAVETLLGATDILSGVRVHDQQVRPFHLSYRTLIGNDLDGIDHGYKIHVVYNLLANPSDAASETMGATIEPKPFEWDLTSVPSQRNGIRPTNHVSFDTRGVAPNILSEVEKRLYGNAVQNPALPSLDELLTLVLSL